MTDPTPAIERAAASLRAQWLRQGLATETTVAEYVPEARVVLAAALEPHWITGELTAHSKKIGHRGWPVPCVCGHPEWSYQHQAEAIRTALLGEGTDD